MGLGGLGELSKVDWRWLKHQAFAIGEILVALRATKYRPVAQASVSPVVVVV